MLKSKHSCCHSCQNLSPSLSRQDNQHAVDMSRKLLESHDVVSPAVPRHDSESPVINAGFNPARWCCCCHWKHINYCLSAAAATGWWWWWWSDLAPTRSSGMGCSRGLTNSDEVLRNYGSVIARSTLITVFLAPSSLKSVKVIPFHRSGCILSEEAIA